MLGQVSTGMSDCVRCGTFISVCNQPLRSTQPGHPFVGRRNEYQPRAVTPCGWGVKAGMVRVWVAGKTVIPVTHGPYLSALEIKRCINSSVYFTFTSGMCSVEEHYINTSTLLCG